MTPWFLVRQTATKISRIWTGNLATIQLKKVSIHSIFRYQNSRWIHNALLFDLHRGSRTRYQNGCRDQRKGRLNMGYNLWDSIRISYVPTFYIKILHRLISSTDMKFGLSFLCVFWHERHVVRHVRRKSPQISHNIVAFYLCLFLSTMLLVTETM
jgi:hypothetical protein